MFSNVYNLEQGRRIDYCNDFNNYKKKPTKERKQESDNIRT